MPRKIFLVICEGETEKVYVEALRRYYRLPITIKTRVCGNCINARLVEQYVAELGIDGPGDYCIFYIYDADVQCVADKISALPGTVILTNPCLELWYVLHNIEQHKSVSSDAVIKILKNSHSAWKAYAKGSLTQEQSSLLTANCKLAVSRTQKLDWPHNPSSNMHRFIEALENPGNC